MAKLSKKEFAAQVLKDTKWLSNYIIRKQVVVVGEGKEATLDTNDPVNKAFLKTHGFAKGIVAPVATIEEPRLDKLVRTEKAPRLTLNDEEGGNDDEYGQAAGVDWNQILPYNKSIQLRTHYEAEKKEKEIIKLELEIAKKQGEVVPADLVAPLAFQLQQELLTTMKQACENLLNEYGHKYSMDQSDKAAFRTYYIKQLNDAMTSGAGNFAKKLDVLLNEFSTKRGVGERS